MKSCLRSYERPGCGDEVIKKSSNRFDRVLLRHGEARDGTAEKGGGGEGSLEKQTGLFFKHLPNKFKVNNNLHPKAECLSIRTWPSIAKKQSIRSA